MECWKINIIVIKYLYFNLIWCTSGSKDKNFIRKIFDDFDLNQNDIITIDEFANMVAKLEISVERKYLRGIFRNIDLDKSGAIEFEEFYAFATK